MTELFSLGELYVSDFLAPDEKPRAAPADLTLVMDDDTKLVHLAEQPPAELMWGRYWYRSGTNATMCRELEGIVDEIESLVSIGGLWVDIASNDGTLLEAVNDAFTAVGVDPVEGDIYDEALLHADEVIQSPFASSVADAILRENGEAKVVTCIAMFYDLLDPTDFLEGVHRLLDRDGVFVLQMSYTPLMLNQLAFDNICHEHARYYTLTTLQSTLTRAGFKIMDATLNDTNGGSFRVYAMRDDADQRKFASQPYRDVAEMRTSALLTNEMQWEFNSTGPWLRFWHRIDSLRSRVRTHIIDARARGETVWGYGASTKGNTLLQFFGLDHTMIDGIAERQEAKWGLRTVGTNIPIYSEDDMRKAKPDYLLMLPWHFVSEFTEREGDYLAGGGKFIVPCPRFEVIG